jgi:anti-sigma regulatory factor (Ser/Thr protein kinase)
LSEAMVNAIDHGNLELNSKMREGEHGNEYHELGDRRKNQEPYCNRRVFITCRVSAAEAVFSIRDEGPGFDPSKLPDPADPENLMRPHGRGLMLIRTFMDNVTFSESGNEIRMHKYARTEQST